MKPLKPAVCDQSSVIKVVNDLHAKWVQGDKLMREQFPASDATAAMAAMLAHMEAMNANEQIFINNRYQVHVRPMGDGGMYHLSIRRMDRQPIHDWRDLQEIKNQLLGPECEAVEIYPAESRKVDSANQYHLWGVKDPTYRFPFGFDAGRMVSDDSIGDSVNRPLSEKEKNA